MTLREFWTEPGTIVRRTGRDISFTEISLYPDDMLDRYIVLGEAGCLRGECRIYLLNPTEDSGLIYYFVGAFP